MFGYVLKSMLARKGSHLVAVLSVGLTIAVSVLSLNYYRSLRTQLVDTGRPDNVVILNSAVLNANKSAIEKPIVDAIRALPEIAQHQGEPLVSAVTVTSIFIKDELIPLRGVTPMGFAVHDHVRIIQGRAFASNEPGFIVGKRLLAQWPDLQVGSLLPYGKHEWPILGVFSAEGSAFEGEVWVDRSTLVNITRIRTLALVARADAQVGVEGLLKALEQMKIDPSLGMQISARPEPEYYLSLGGRVDLVRDAVTGIMIILLIGAAVAAANALHASFMSRFGEFAALWVVGHRRGRLVKLLLQEALVLGMFSAVLAIAANAVALAVTDGRLMASLGVFELRFGPSVVLDALALGAAITLLGVALPALRVSRSDLRPALA
jgi:putative ABC transport system permease protein